MGPRQMSVCFSGYRPEKLPWGEDESDPRCAALKKRLYDAAESACAQGYRHFICGMARGVDFYACEAVLRLRRDYPNVTVEAAIPCPSQPEGWPEAERARWRELVALCDYETVVQITTTPGVCSGGTGTWWITPPCSSPSTTDSPAVRGAPLSTPCAGGWMW